MIAEKMKEQDGVAIYRMQDAAGYSYFIVYEKYHSYTEAAAAAARRFLQAQEKGDTE